MLGKVPTQHEYDPRVRYTQTLHTSVHWEYVGHMTIIKPESRGANEYCPVVGVAFREEGFGASFVWRLAFIDGIHWSVWLHSDRTEGYEIHNHKSSMKALRSLRPRHDWSWRKVQRIPIRTRFVDQFWNNLLRVVRSRAPCLFFAVEESQDSRPFSIWPWRRLQKRRTLLVEAKSHVVVWGSVVQTTRAEILVYKYCLIVSINIITGKRKCILFNWMSTCRPLLIKETVIAAEASA